MAGAVDRVMILTLLNKKAFTTTASSGSPDVYDLGDPLKNIGWLLDGIQGYVLGDTFAGTFEYALTGQYSYDGVTWSDFSGDIISATTAEGNKVSARFTDSLDFGPHIRFRLKVWRTSGTGTGNISLKVALRFLAA